MNKEYIPVLVESSGKKEVWRIDITKLSITQLITLREEILSNSPYDKAIQALDSVIKRDIEVTIPFHNINNGSYIRTYKKNKKEQKQKIKIKSIRRNYNDKHKK